MDPLNPIVPHADLTARIPQSPAVPRVSPDEQRQQARDDEHSEQEPDDENFDGLLDEASTSEDFSTDEFFIPEVDRSLPRQDVERPAQERRTVDDDDPEEGPAAGHIDIIA